MDKDEIISQLQELIAGYLENQGLELVELIHHNEGKDLVLRILTDQPQGGISIGECSRLNREIGLLLDEKNIFEQNYILEVSSPGLDRPLFVKNDFARNRNKEVKLFLNEMVNGKLEWDGVINKVEGDSVFIEAGGTIMELPLGKINKGKLLF